MTTREKILIVDDNRTNIEVLQEYLEGDYQLEVALTGEEALVKAVDFQPAVILLDIMMPGIDGYEVSRRIRAHPELRHTKIIMVSARAMLSERLQGYEAGADDYLTKPFDEEELLAKVRVYLRLKSTEEMDQLKSDLLALLSHETRTPLTSIISPVEMLLADDDLDLDNRRMLLGIILQSARNLQNLLEKILLLSELKSGKSRFQMQRADLAELVHEVIERLSPQVGERQIRFDVNLTRRMFTMMDPDKMEHVIRAILDNAIRFSPLAETITVTVARANGQCLFSVTDHGVGIEPAFLPHVFDEFVSTDVNYHAKGHGLSLAIARHIVAAHRGSIDADSIKGVGTTFTVKLPAAGG